MNIAICDDMKEQICDLTGLLCEYRKNQNKDFCIKTFGSVSRLLEVARFQRFDLYFLDVMMPEIDGISAARSIREFDDNAEIVFLTSSPSFALESYSVHAFDYLLKPIQRDTLSKVLDRFFSHMARVEKGITVKCGGALVRIPLSQLVYVEVNGKHLYFNMIDGTEHKAYGYLKEYADVLLRHSEFKQVHRSYIVNMYQISRISPEGISTSIGKTIPVSRLLYQGLQKDYMNLMFEQRGSD